MRKVATWCVSSALAFAAAVAAVKKIDGGGHESGAGQTESITPSYTQDCKHGELCARMRVAKGPSQALNAGLFDL